MQQSWLLNLLAIKQHCLVEQYGEHPKVATRKDFKNTLCNAKTFTEQFHCYKSQI